MVSTFLSALFFTPASSSAQAKTIAPDDPLISYEGCFVIDKNSTRAAFSRFTPDILTSPEKSFDNKRAATTTGIVIKFTTASSKIRANFEITDGENRGSDFGVYKNGTFYKNFPFAETVTDITFEFDTLAQGKAATYEIVLPSWSNTNFKGLVIDAGGTLVRDASVSKNKYVAIGDSITHGTGQGSSSYKSYPFLFSRALGYELYNLAVGAAKVSPAVAKMLEGQDIEIITVLIGYNDWNTVNDLATFKTNYRTLLSYIRQYQPNAKVYCITPTFTRNPKTATYSLEDYRAAIRESVTERNSSGDSNIFLIEGPDLTTEDDLNDMVHLNVSGAANMARKLSEIISRKQKSGA